MVSPAVSIALRAWSSSAASDQSSRATPTIGQSSILRRSRRYSDRNVIFLARSPVMPKITRTSAGVAVGVVTRLLLLVVAAEFAAHRRQHLRGELAEFSGFEPR